MSYIFIVLALALAWPANALAQNKKGMELLEKLNHGWEPQLSQNAYFPPLMKEKLLWILTENRARPTKLVIGARDNFTAPIDVLMGSCFQNGVALIEVSLESLLYFEKRLGYQGLKNLFLLALVHEAIHLEKKRGCEDKYSPESMLEEEIRTWHKWILEVVRPVRAKGYQVNDGLVEADEVLRICANNPDCLLFRRNILGRSSVGQRKQVPK